MCLLDLSKYLAQERQTRENWKNIKLVKICPALSRKANNLKSLPVEKTV